MKTVLQLAAVVAILGPVLPAAAAPIPSRLLADPGYQQVQYPGDATRPFYGNANGGYRVNRYGYGNYTGGPDGGFAGYPAGSAGAQIYRQKQEFKCRDVPERC